jgi:hypothetical protein
VINLLRFPDDFGAFRIVIGGLIFPIVVIVIGVVGRSVVAGVVQARKRKPKRDAPRAARAKLHRSQGKIGGVVGRDLNVPRWVAGGRNRTFRRRPAVLPRLSETEEAKQRNNTCRQKRRITQLLAGGARAHKACPAAHTSAEANTLASRNASK